LSLFERFGGGLGLAFLTRHGRAPQDRAKPAVMFIWDRFGPSHVDRCEAAGAGLADRFRTYGLEIASYDAKYAWEKSGTGASFTKITVFPDRVRSSVNQLVCFLAVARTCLSVRPRFVFACNYEDPVIFALMILLRGMGVRVFNMQDSKFDDKQRYLVSELAKSLLYCPYHGALVGSYRSADYLRLLGVPERRIFVGYDAISVERIRALAGSPAAPEGAAHAERHFTIIARFIPEKNLPRTLEAYAAYARDCLHDGRKPRELHLCGSGELEPMLRDYCERAGLTQVIFRGFLQEEEVAKVLASTLALILPSAQETFGLVINEAIAMGVPVLISTKPGARDLLVRNGVNGYVFEPDAMEALTHYLSLLDRDAGEWQRLSRASSQFVPMADAQIFVQAVRSAVNSFARPEVAP
jgi:glycosyltransferase involved in cell wall biosynthesis